MRNVVFEAAHKVDPEQQLSTGEAAKLLNSSRQHIVDLCESGRLPYTTVGKHRRVRRGDLDAVRTRTERLTADQSRSLWVAFAIAGRIAGDPDGAAAIAQRNIQRMRSATRGSAARWLDEWVKLLAGPVETMLAAYTSRDLRGRELRQNAPFAGLLTEAERNDVLASWRKSRDRASTRSAAQ